MCPPVLEPGTAVSQNLTAFLRLQSPQFISVAQSCLIKFDTVSTVSPSIAHEVMGPDAMIFVF